MAIFNVDSVIRAMQMFKNKVNDICEITKNKVWSEVKGFNKVVVINFEGIFALVVD